MAEHNIHPHKSITLCRLLPFLGPAQCAEQFGIPSASGRDIYLADEDKCLHQGRQVFWPERLADQQRVVASQVTQVGRLGKDTVLAGNGSVTL